jgi:hypothetical protein
MNHFRSYNDANMRYFPRALTLLVLLFAVFSFCSLTVPSTASAQQFFGAQQPPNIGSLPVGNAGVQAQMQGYFIKDWWKQGRGSSQPTPSQASPFNAPPWGVSK